MRALQNFVARSVVAAGLAASCLIPSRATADLVGHWAMDEAGWNGTAGEVADSSPTGNGGQRVGDATTTAAGRLGRAGIFDGSADYVSIPSHTSLDLQSDGTIATWARFNSLPSGTHTIVGSASYSTGFLFNQFGDRFYAYYKSGGPSITTPAGFLATDQWYHLVLTNDSGSLDLYIDGVHQGSNPEGGNAFAQQALQIGGGAFPSIDGNVDDLAIWNEGLDTARARSLFTVPENLAVNYNAGDLVELWEIFDAEGTGKVQGTQWQFTDLPGTFSPGDAFSLGSVKYIALSATTGLKSIPEPSTAALLAAFGPFLVRRRRRT